MRSKEAGRTAVRALKVAIASCLLVMAIAATAQASIVINKSIGGVALGFNQEQVIAQWGPPTSTLSYGTVERLFYERTARGVDTVTLHQGQVVGITTYLTSERTKNGIGPGVSIRKVRKAFPRMIFALDGGAAEASAYLAITRRPAKRGQGTIHTMVRGKVKAWNQVDGTPFTGIGRLKRVTYLTVGRWGTTYNADACFMKSCAG